VSTTTFLPSEREVLQVGTTRGKFADNFAGVAAAAGQPSIDALIARGWRIVRSNGITVTLNNGSLVLGLGTTNGSEFLMVGPARQTIPANLTAVLALSQRLAANEVRVGYVAVDPSTGLPIPHGSLAGSFANYAAMLFTGTTATTATLETLADNLASPRALAAANMATTAAAADYSIEVRNEDVTILSGVADSNAVRTTGSARSSVVVPNPDLAYAPFVWVRNVAAPASNTNVTLNRIVALDIQELQAEVGGGRGNQTPSQSVPVVIAAGGAATPVSISGTTGVSGAAVATTNGLTAHKLISAASTNLTSVKTTAGRISGGIVTNASASWRYLKLFSKNSAPVIPTDVPFATIGLPPNSSVDLGALFDQYGIHFAAGIAYAITAGPADADNTAIGANEVVVLLLFA
jgi:hypothetical protein